ncbi:beta-ketoacyl-[acyl-carrier-protein] synthase family protein, partial [Klebsiella pneumoniae]|nr:beta-ketoacyl-[acyl-carrier-protein] synthase family protein [Klebsiella pneumoniae]
IGYAYEAIKYGLTDMMLAGGGEEFFPSEVYVFDSLYAASRRNGEPEKTPRPYDANRDGLVIGEGAGIFVLEELEHAKKRGAKIYAEIVGFGMSSDAYHITAPNEEGPALAVTRALKDAGINPEDVDYVNAHGTSTPLGDANETKALKRAFGEHAYKTVVSSAKSITGHLLGAAGGVEAVYSILAIHDGKIPPTIN